MSSSVRSGQGGATNAGRQDNGLVQSLTRALGLLEILAANKHGLRLKQLSYQAGLAPSTAHRLLTTLEQKRFVHFEREGCLWSIGSNCFVIGVTYARRDLVTEALPHLQNLSDRIGETVSIGVHDDGKLLLLRQTVPRARPPSIPLEVPGAKLALHASAMGKILLSAGRSRPAGVVSTGPLARMTARTIVHLDQLEQELSSVRARGFAIDDEESGTGKRCVAAPIFDELGKCIAAISVSGSKSRLSDGLLPKLSAMIAGTAGDVTQAVGGCVRGPARQSDPTA